MTKRFCFFLGFFLLAFASLIKSGNAQAQNADNRALLTDKHSYSPQLVGADKTVVTVKKTTGFVRGLSLDTMNNGAVEKELSMQENGVPQGDLIRLQDFHYRIEQAQNPSGEIIVLLHGSGGDETTLFSFARPIWPRATLVGIRGRLVQKGETRWFRKISPTKFDQNDVVNEAEAFVKFLERLGDEGNYDLSRVTFVGYSNGANFLAVILMEHPDLVKRAVLLRSMPVLDNMPHENLSKTNVLIISGKKDSLYSPFQPALSALLKKNGAKVENYMIDGDHMIGQADADMIAKWVFEQNTSHISSNTKTGKLNQ